VRWCAVAVLRCVNMQSGFGLVLCRSNRIRPLWPLHGTENPDAVLV
jgi:hypothetical protein